jgi:DNA-binding CsgD family transcriptional regulator
MEKKKKEMIMKSIGLEQNPDSEVHQTIDCNPILSEDSCENFPIGFQVSFRYNIAESIFIDINTDVDKLLGIPKQDILGKDASELFYEIMPEENIEALGELIQKSYLICKDHRKSKSLVINLDFNVITRNKKEKRILCQYRPIAFGMNGYPMQTAGYWTDITHIKKDGLPVMFAVIDNKIDFVEMANPEYLIKSPNIIFTSKEIEIIKMTSDGNRIKEISDKMKISISTVYTHRKNIKMKSEKEMNQVINELKSKGII